MKMRTRAAAGSLLFVLAFSAAFAQKAVILVRHAEKADSSKDPVLSETGQIRAKALAAFLAKTGISAIYCSEYQRTKLTAEPTAAALSLAIRVAPASDSAGLVERLRKDHAADTVLVVGHSNTLPDIMKRFGHPVEESIADDDYGNIFVLIPQEGKPPVLMRLRY